MPRGFLLNNQYFNIGYSLFIIISESFTMVSNIDNAVAIHISFYSFNVYLRFYNV